LLHKASSYQPFISGNEELARVLAAFDYEKLKLFFISLVWRASISAEMFYAGVNLGPFEAPARQAILQEQSGDANFFSVILGRWKASAKHQHLTKAMLHPNRVRLGHATGYRFYLADCIAYIKCSGGDLPADLRQIRIEPGRPLVLFSASFEESSEFAAIRKTALVADKARKEGRY
jgi:hypothetical protein